MNENASQSPKHTPKRMESDSERMRDIVSSALEEAGGEDICVLDVRDMTDITDYMIVTTGTSHRHVKTLSNRVLEFMHNQGWPHIGIEGEAAGDWILVDFVDVVVHIMRQASRKKYDLESLWERTFNRPVSSET